MEQEISVETDLDKDDLVLLRIPEVCRRLCLGKTTIDKLIATNQLRSITVGRARLIPRAALDEFANGQYALATGHYALAS